LLSSATIPSSDPRSRAISNPATSSVVIVTTHAVIAASSGASWVASSPP
jgi:hypothetical protein